MNREKINYGDIVFYENGTRVLIGPPSGGHNDWGLQYSAIEITNNEDNCKLFNEFHTIKKLLSCYKQNKQKTSRACSEDECFLFLFYLNEKR